MQVRIKQASGLPLSLSHFVFCQYTFWSHGDTIVVPPVVNPETELARHLDSITFQFDHTKDFTVPISEELLEHCAGKFYTFFPF